MGNGVSRYSFESLNPERYDEVRLSSLSMCGEYETVKFPFDQRPPSLKDDILLWNEFGKEINELLPLLNLHLGLLNLMIPVLFLGTWFGYTTFLSSFDENNSPIIFFIAFFAVFFVILMAQIKIYSRNAEVDKKIHEVCSNYTRRFQEHGIVPEYRTRWTELCKPKHARPLRMIVFIPAGNQQV